MKQLLIATHNFGKYKEIASALEGIGITLLNLDDLEIHQDVEETGTSYEENAEIKARFFSKLSGLPTIADDSGIIIEALKGELGIHTRRWGAGPNATDEEWMDYFMNRMEHESNRNAEFFTTIAFLLSPEKEVQFFQGVCKGTITHTIEAEYLKGIPLSAVFKPVGLNTVYSALLPEEKNKISHRGRAVMSFKQFLLESDLIE